MERLQKIIAQSGYCSRRKAEELISLGLVKVNGNVIREMGHKVSPTDVITVEGQLIVSEDPVYYILNKPKGYLSSTVSQYNKPCVIDLLADVKERIYPIGRLDYNTSGLLLLTNDGEFSNLMMHPRYKVWKVYRVRCRGKLSGADIFKLQNGIEIEGYKTKKAKVRVIKYTLATDDSIVEISIAEGKNQQIRKMFLEIHHPVKQLKRIKYGTLDVSDLANGESRRLKIHEVKKLYNLAKFGQ